MAQAIARNDGQARRLATDLVAQWRVTLAWLRELPAAAFERDSVVAHHSVRDLVGHLLFQVIDLTQTLQQPTTRRPVPLLAHLRLLSGSTSRMDEFTRQTVGQDDGPALVHQLAVLLPELERELSGDLPTVVETLFEPLRVSDLFKTATLELVEHSDDLSRSLPDEGPLPLERGALTTAARILADALADAHPGRSVEVRVPPAVAVQLSSPEGGGPTHTRGTPPTVVETSPLTFVRLASGRTTFAAALAANDVSASGAHADLSRFLPVFRH